MKSIQHIAFTCCDLTATKKGENMNHVDVGIIGCGDIARRAYVPGGGMCDAFRQSVQRQFMTGGNWVTYPGGDGIKYIVNIKHSSSSIVTGLKDFQVKSEQYYLHVVPAIEVLATPVSYL